MIIHVDMYVYILTLFKMYLLRFLHLDISIFLHHYISNYIFKPLNLKKTMYYIFIFLIISNICICSLYTTVL